MTLQSATPIYLSGTLNTDLHSGIIGMGISTSALTTMLKTLGYPDAASLLADLADLDTDEDGAADAISTAFTFSAAPCGLQP